MSDLSPGFKQKIVREELKRLEQEQHISSETYTKIVNAHVKYYENLQKKRQEQMRIEQARREEQRRAKKTYVRTPDQPEKKRQVRQPIPEPVKRELSPQEARERNITWLLNLGVILLLFGGVILATSTWEVLADWMKTGLIGLVAIMFYSLAFVTGRFLKIKKTAFAFLVLGSLFLPIVVLSAGYFQLFGTYFSIFGEGKFLYGAIGSFVILPIYYLFATRFKSRLFVWFTYVTLSSFVSFLIGSLHLPVDGFYLAIMLFNALLISGYLYVKKNNQLEQFTKEFVPYIQGNLILSTFFMLIFFQHELVYSFNLFLTAALYFALIYVTNHRHYHFVFSAILVYGAYQLIEFSVLHEISSIAYALIGFFFLALPKFISGQRALQKAFQYTSAFISAAAFIYITFEGILIRMNEPSIMLVIAYVIIALNFIFLVNAIQQRLFAYLSSIFIMAALYEIVLLSRLWYGYEEISLPTFFAGVLLYIGLGCLNTGSFLKRIKASSRDIATLVMIVSILGAFVFIHWLDLGIMLLAFSIVMLFMRKFDRRKFFTESEVAPLLHSVTLGLAINFFYLEWRGGEYLVPANAESIVIASLVVLMSSFAWKSMKRNVLNNYAFYSAQVFYGLGILSSFTFDTESVVRALIMFGGIGMAYLLYRKTKWVITPYLLSSMSLLFYLTSLLAIHDYLSIEAELFLSLQFIGGAVLLLAIGIFVGKWDLKLRRSYLLVGHLYLPVALCIGFLLLGHISVWAFLVATAIYAATTLRVTNEWFTKLFLYSSLTSFWATIGLFLLKYDVENGIPFSFFISSVLIACLWYVSKAKWPRRMAYYFIPFSLIGMLSFIDAGLSSNLLLSMTLIYAVFILIVMYQEKWDILSVLPLALSYLALFIFQFVSNYETTTFFFMDAGFAMILIAVGRTLYPALFKDRLGKVPIVDWYTLVGFGALFGLYLYASETLWMSVLPGVLISALLVVQRNRILTVKPKWIVFTALVYLMQPFYAFLDHIPILPLIEVELYALPWVFYSILFKKFATEFKKATVNYIQWVVLGIVALILLDDALVSGTIHDAIILGLLSLSSILAGVSYQQKSFFFIGSGVLLLNVFIQTRPFWGELPWWVYLLIAGSILIGVASYYEYNRQRIADGEEAITTTLKDKIANILKKWD